FFQNTALKINNSNGVTLTNNNASVCLFKLGDNAGLSIQSGNIALGEADVFGYSTVNSFASFGNVSIDSATWPVTNPPVNINIEGSCLLPGPRTVQGTLTMINGILNTNNFTLTIGASASAPGEVVRTGGSIKGTLKRWIPASTTAETLFPMDDNSGQYVPAKISFTDAPDAGGSLTAAFISSGAGTNGLPIPDGPGGFEITNSAPGYWIFNSADGLSGYTYDIECIGADFPGVSNTSTLSMLKRNDSGSPWTWSSANHVTSGGTITEPIIRGKNFTSFSEFTMGSEMDNPLPVELSAFTSSINTRDVKLNWVTTYENNNAGFDIERSIKNEGKAEWKKIGHMQGAGTTNNATTYNFEDRKLETGKYAYRLKQIDYNGTYKYYELINEVIVGVPDKYSLSQNYPNPFNPSTKIDYNLPYDSKVEIRMYDMTGKEVASIVNVIQHAGYYTVNFNGANLSSGTYFYRITAEGGNNKFATTKKMMLVK
ncbi:MAG: T9SS type A sorting domain-containing protein, partial [Ignavibacteria bacterium]|nr:T9SS type A sorting domain-containing protein [Ignavibacteria bacterium]